MPYTIVRFVCQMPFLKNNCRRLLSSLIKFVYKHANTCLVTLYMKPVTKKKNNIDTTENEFKKNSPLAHCYSSSFKLFHLVQTYVYSFERLRRRKKNSFETLHFRFNFPHPTQTKVKSSPREGLTVKFPTPRPQIVVKCPGGGGKVSI